MPSRSLWPREHGAYFQLAIPIATAFASRIPTAAAIAIALGAMLAFLANEPLLVILGHRGPRARALEGARARRRLVMLAGAAVVLGSSGLVAAPSALVAAAIAAVPALVLLGFAWRRAEHTLGGELVAAVALTGAATPVLAASGASLEHALPVWLGFALGFSASVLAVHRVIARHKRAATRVDVVTAATMIAVSIAIPIAAPSLSVALPLLLVSAALVIASPSARRLRAIGVAIAITALASGALAIAT